MKIKFEEEAKYINFEDIDVIRQYVVAMDSQGTLAFCDKDGYFCNILSGNKSWEISKSSLEKLKKVEVFNKPEDAEKYILKLLKEKYE